MTALERRRYNREWARQRRAQRLAARNAGATTCQLRMGRYGRCGGVLHTLTDGVGNARVVCERCERKRRGICRDCGLPVVGTVGKALRCAHHAKVEKLAASARHYHRDVTASRAEGRRNYEKNDARRRQKNEYKKAWRRANPEKVKAYKERERQSEAYQNRLAYFADYRAAHRRKYRTMQNKRNAGTLPPRLCVVPGCSIVVTHRKKKCSKCVERERARSQQTLEATKGKGRRTDLTRNAERVA